MTTWDQYLPEKTLNDFESLKLWNFEPNKLRNQETSKPTNNNYHKDGFLFNLLRPISHDLSRIRCEMFPDFWGFMQRLSFLGSFLLLRYVEVHWAIQLGILSNKCWYLFFEMIDRMVGLCFVLVWMLWISMYVWRKRGCTISKNNY